MAFVSEPSSTPAASKADPLFIEAAHPLTQALARAVIKWSTGAMNPQPGRLAGDQYFSLCCRPYHRSRLML